ncbi:hypothetical protein [Enterococcus sp. LJL51]|uniref:hypothetical protein n=1 Tax=Enterococcus sp. LJL51 TaxID=3416656 RepID=UPI003CED03A5
MKKTIILGAVLLSLTGLGLAGCGSNESQSGNKAEQSTKANQKSREFDEIQVGLSKDDLTKTYGAPKETITDMTKVMQEFTTDMTTLQSAAEDQKTQEKLVNFFGGSQEKMQEELTNMLANADEGLEMLVYENAGETIRIYLTGSKVLLRTF